MPLFTVNWVVSTLKLLQITSPIDCVHVQTFLLGIYVHINGQYIPRLKISLVQPQ